jgi:hypothetical protein
MSPNERRFPPPWSVEELDACFVVKDAAGQKMAFVYFEDEAGRRSAANISPKRGREGLQRLGIAFVKEHQHKHDEADNEPDRKHRDVGLSFPFLFPLSLTFSCEQRF